jgi:hypothetical protein
MTKKKIVYYSIVVFMVNIQMINILHAQQDSSASDRLIGSVSNHKSQPILWWLSFGLGGSSISEANQFTYCIGAIMTLKSGSNFFSAGVIHDQGIHLLSPNQMIFDARALYGIGFHRELWFGNASAGLAYTATTKRIFDHVDSSGAVPEDIYRGELFRGVGFAWQGQLFSKFSDSSHVGLGITICGNINKSFSFWMLLFSLEFGSF